MTATVIYKGGLRCEAKHLQSGSMIETDAPTDNRGKGGRFSPTDLLCVSLATCIITTMGIKAGDLGIDLSDTEMEVTKHMVAEPRRAGKIGIVLRLKAAVSVEDKDRLILERTGDNCPVMKSLNPELAVEVIYNWG